MPTDLSPEEADRIMGEEIEAVLALFHPLMKALVLRYQREPEGSVRRALMRTVHGGAIAGVAAWCHAHNGGALSPIAEHAAEYTLHEIETRAAAATAAMTQEGPPS